jgi:hypothetical protein
VGTDPGGARTSGGDDMSEPIDVWELVKADMEIRQQKGLAEYGVPVLAGTDLRALLYWLRHNYAEVLDAAVYTRAAIETVEAILAKENREHTR